VNDIDKNTNIDQFFSILSLSLFCQYALGGLPDDLQFLSDATSNGSNVIGEHIVLGFPVWRWIPRIKHLLKDVVDFKARLVPLLRAREKLIGSGQPYPDDCLSAMIVAKVGYQ